MQYYHKIDGLLSYLSYFSFNAVNLWFLVYLIMTLDSVFYSDLFIFHEYQIPRFLAAFAMHWDQQPMLFLLSINRGPCSCLLFSIFVASIYVYTVWMALGVFFILKPKGKKENVFLTCFLWSKIDIIFVFLLYIYLSVISYHF